METTEVFFGDYPARLERLYVALKDALDNEGEVASTTLAEGHPVTQLQGEIDALKQEAREAKKVIKLQGLGRNAWRELREAHPPRNVGDSGVSDKMAEADQSQGVNLTTVEDDLIWAALVSPEFADRDAFDAWLATDPCTPGQWSTAVQEAWGLTHGRPFDPGSMPASLTWNTD